MIDQFSFPHAPPSSRDINLAQKYPMKQVVDVTKLVPYPMFFDNTIISEFRYIIHQADENSVLTASVLIGNSNLV